MLLQVMLLQQRPDSAEYCLFDEALLQKRPTILKEPTNRSHPTSSLLTSASEALAASIRPDRGLIGVSTARGEGKFVLLQLAF